MKSKFSKMTKGQLAIIANVTGNFTKEQLIELANIVFKNRLSLAIA